MGKTRESANLTSRTNIYSDISNLRVGIAIANPSETLHVSGNILSTGDINSNSDIKLKTNIKTIPDALEKVLSMRGVEFDRIDLEGKHQIGVIAQEIEEVLPDLVTENDGIKSVSYGNITAVLIEAIKVQQEQINSLKEEIQSLKK
jgi:putative lipoic acid-binding regulatory protein